MRQPFTILFLFLTFSLSAQTINRVDVIQGPTNNAPDRWKGKVIENNGKFYIYRSERMQGDFIVNDTLIREINFGDDVLGLSTSHSLIPIYEVDKGVTDHIPLEFAKNIGFHARDSLITTAGLAKYLLIDQDTIYGDLINGEQFKAEGFLMVADQNLDIKLLERVFPSRDHRTLITEDAIYFAYNWSTNAFYPESIFMGENFDDGDDDADVILHKIDRSTMTRVWSKRIATNADSDFIIHFTLDKEDNIVMVIDGAGGLFYEDSTLFSYANAPEDYFDDFHTESYILKINSEGDILDHLVYYGNGTQTITDIVFSENNEMVLVGSLGTFGSAYLGDEIIELEEGNNPGYITKYDSEWNLEWYKLYDGKLGYATSAFLDNDEIIVSYQSIVSIEDNDELFDEPASQGSFHLHKLDTNGNEITGTISGGKEGAIFDIKKVEENRYLLFILETTYSSSYKFSLFDYETTNPVQSPRIFVFDISGDLFESVTAISEILNSNEIKIYPNPISNTQTLNISVPKKATSSQFKVTISSINGNVEYDEELVSINHKLTINMEQILPGIKIVSLQSGNQLYTTQLLIK